MFLFLATHIEEEVYSKICEEKPGLFHISLNASQKPPVHEITHRIKVTDKLIRDFPTGFTNRAARNLLGVLYFYNGECFKAVQTFQKILEDHPDSLTAMANLAFVYESLKQTSMATMYLDDLNKNETNTEKSVALGDQAFAFLFDCVLEFETNRDIIERNEIAIGLLVQNLSVLGESECNEHTVVEVKYWLSQTYYRIFSKCQKGIIMKDKIEEYFLKGTKELADIVQMAEKTATSICKEVVSTAWAFIGLFLSNKWTIAKRDDDKIEEHLKHLNFFEYLNDPEICFKNGIEIAQKNDPGEKKSKISTELLIRYALYLKSKNKIKDALEKLDEAIEIDNTQGNWFAFSIRADVLSVLKRMDDSISDLELACSWNPIPRNLCKLAKVYQKKYQSCKDKDSKNAKEYLERANHFFSSAIISSSYEEKSKIFNAYAKFLQQIGKTTNAKKYFNQSDVSKKTKNTFLSFVRSCVDLSDKNRRDKDKILHLMTQYQNDLCKQENLIYIEFEKYITKLKGDRIDQAQHSSKEKKKPIALGETRAN